MTYEEALQILKFKREFADTELSKALDIAIDCISNSIKSPIQ